MSLSSSVQKLVTAGLRQLAKLLRSERQDGNAKYYVSGKCFQPGPFPIETGEYERMRGFHTAIPDCKQPYKPLWMPDSVCFSTRKLAAIPTCGAGRP